MDRIISDIFVHDAILLMYTLTVDFELIYGAISTDTRCVLVNNIRWLTDPTSVDTKAVPIPTLSTCLVLPKQLPHRQKFAPSQRGNPERSRPKFRGAVFVFVCLWKLRGRGSDYFDMHGDVGDFHIHLWQSLNTIRRRNLTHLYL